MRDWRIPFPALAMICCLTLTAAALPAQETRTPTLAPPPADEGAQEDEAPAEKRLDLRLSLGIESDDNILHLRDEAIDEFESGDFDPDRFLIDSVDDTILTPRLDLSYSSTPETRRRSRLGFTAAAYRYTDNSIKDYERYQLFFERDFSDIRPDMRRLELTTTDLKSTRFRTRRAFLKANRSRLRLRYTFGPERYVGQLTDDDGGGRRSVRVETNGWDLAYLQRLDGGDESRWSLLLRVRRDEYDYNAEFDERDSDRDRLEVGLDNFQLGDDAYWRLGASVELVERRSNTALIGQQGPAGTIQDDLSYDGEALILRLGRTWYRLQGDRSLYKTSSIALQLQFGVKDYITENQLDPSHYLREDDYVSVLLALTHPLSNHWVVQPWIEFAQQETNLEPLPEFDRLEPSDFENTVFGIRISYYASRKS